MRHGSLFSGIGGFDLAAEWMGWENVFHCEKEKFCQQVLTYYWPKATLHEDIRNTDFTIYRYRIDILTGGFPCQPYTPQENDLEKKMTATSGRKCLEQFGRFPRAGSWAKTFAALLIGMEGWYSTRCRLTWKLKGTKSYRFYFQLVPSTHPTDVTGYGLWPTPTSVQRDHPERVEKLKATGAKTMTSRAAGENRPNSILDAAMFYGILPTPQSRDWRSPDKPDSGNMKRKLQKGWTIDLNSLAPLLPTPTASSDAKGGCTRKDAKRQNDTLAHAIHGMQGEPGKTSQLNPRFVAEMMGFPPNWTELPFQNRETRA